LPPVHPRGAVAQPQKPTQLFGLQVRPGLQPPLAANKRGGRQGKKLPWHAFGDGVPGLFVPEPGLPGATKPSGPGAGQVRPRVGGYKGTLVNVHSDFRFQELHGQPPRLALL